MINSASDILIYYVYFIEYCLATEVFLLNNTCMEVFCLCLFYSLLVWPCYFLSRAYIYCKGIAFYVTTVYLPFIRIRVTFSAMSLDCISCSISKLNIVDPHLETCFHEPSALSDNVFYVPKKNKKIKKNLYPVFVVNLSI